MPIIFDEVTAEVAPPAPTASPSENRGSNGTPQIDPRELLGELQRVAERAERLKAD